MLFRSLESNMVLDAEDNVYLSTGRQVKKYGADGQLQWNIDEQATNVNYATDGSIVIIEEKRDEGMSDELVKIDSYGEELWRIALGKDGIIWQTTPGDDGVTYVIDSEKYESLRLYKIDESGTVVWARSLSEMNYLGYSSLVYNWNGVIFVQAYTSNYEQVMYVIDEDGELLLFDSKIEWLGFSAYLHIDSDGCLWSYFPENILNTPEDAYHIRPRVIRQYDESLSMLVAMNPQAIDVIQSFQLDSGNNIIIFGSPYNPPSNIDDGSREEEQGVIVEKMSYESESLWHIQTSDHRYPLFFGVDSHDYIFWLEGFRSPKSINYLYRASPLGEFLWKKRFDLGIVFQNLKIDHHDNVVLLYTRQVVAKDNDDDDDDEPGCGCF